MSNTLDNLKIISLKEGDLIEYNSLIYIAEHFYLEGDNVLVLKLYQAKFN